MIVLQKLHWMSETSKLKLEINTLEKKLMYHHTYIKVMIEHHLGWFEV